MPHAEGFAAAASKHQEHELQHEGFIESSKVFQVIQSFSEEDGEKSCKESSEEIFEKFDEGDEEEFIIE